MGNQPSLRASIQRGKWNTVHEILQTQEGKDRARTKTYTIDDETETALQLACLHRAPASIISMLIQTGQPTRVSSPSQLSPLHFCMMNSVNHTLTSPQVVRILLNAFPDDVSHQSRPCQKIPLHIACETRVPPDVVQMLYEADPTSAGVRDARGKTALEYAKTHRWLLHPLWRHRVKRILQGEHVHVPTIANATTPQEARPPPPSITIATPPPVHHHPTTTPASPPPVAVATATLVVPEPATTLPVARATVVDTIVSGPIPAAPPESMMDDEKDLCVLCWDQRADMALIPCGHVCLCNRCCSQSHILNDTLRRKCPVCRIAFRQPLRIYQAGIHSSSS